MTDYLVRQGAVFMDTDIGAIGDSVIFVASQLLELELRSA